MSKRNYYNNSQNGITVLKISKLIKRKLYEVALFLFLGVLYRDRDIALLNSFMGMLKVSAELSQSQKSGVLCTPLFNYEAGNSLVILTLKALTSLAFGKVNVRIPLV